MREAVSGLASACAGCSEASRRAPRRRMRASGRGACERGLASDSSRGRAGAAALARVPASPARPCTGCCTRSPRAIWSSPAASARYAKARRVGFFANEFFMPATFFPSAVARGGVRLVITLRRPLERIVSHCGPSPWTLDAFVACGGKPDKTGHVHRDTLVKIIKHDFCKNTAVATVDSNKISSGG